jgi:hypothetical protein
MVSPFLNSRTCSGHTGRSQARGPSSQVPSSAFTVGPPKVETVTGRAASRKQKSAVPPGAGQARSSDRARVGMELWRHASSQRSHLHAGSGGPSSSQPFSSVRGFHKAPKVEQRCCVLQGSASPTLPYRASEAERSRIGGKWGHSKPLASLS